MNIKHHLDAIESGIDGVIHDVSAERPSERPARHGAHNKTRWSQPFDRSLLQTQKPPETIATMTAAAELTAPPEVAEPSIFGASVLDQLGSMPQPEAASEALHLALALLDRYLPDGHTGEASTRYESAGVTPDTGTTSLPAED